MVWDVRSLLRLAEPLPVFDVPLADIAETKENWWFQDGEVPSVTAILHHIRMMEKVDLAYPILLCAEGRLMDGMHRVARALKEGHTTIPARRFVVTPPPDFVDVDLKDLPYD